MIVGRVAQSAGALLYQAELHAELLRIEWAEEKMRLSRMAVALLASIACLLALLFALSVLVVTLCWDTPLRLPAVIALVVLYALGAALAWGRFRAQAARGDQSFAASRSELSADLLLLRSQL